MGVNDAQPPMRPVSRRFLSVAKGRETAFRAPERANAYTMGIWRSFGEDGLVTPTVWEFGAGAALDTP